MDEFERETQPSGALTPPPGGPRTALATATPQPPRRPTVRGSALQRRGLRGLLESALDGLDSLADRIADAAGLR
jgi:hypothetical protein